MCVVVAYQRAPLPIEPNTDETLTKDQPNCKYSYVPPTSYIHTNLHTDMPLNCCDLRCMCVYWGIYVNIRIRVTREKHIYTAGEKKL